MNETALRKDFEKLVTDIADRVIVKSSVNQISSVEKEAVKSLKSMSSLASEGFESQISRIMKSVDQLFQQHERLSKEILVEIERKYINRVAEAENSFSFAKQSIDKFSQESHKLSELAVDLQQYENLIAEILKVEEIIQAQVKDFHIVILRKMDEIAMNNSDNLTSIKTHLSTKTQDVELRIKQLEQKLQENKSETIKNINSSRISLVDDIKLQNKELKAKHTDSTNTIRNIFLTRSKEMQDDIMEKISVESRTILTQTEQKVDSFKKSQNVRSNWLIFLNIVLIGITGTLLYFQLY